MKKHVFCIQKSKVCMHMWDNTKFNSEQVGWFSFKWIIGYLRYFQNKVTPFSTKLSLLFSEVTNIALKLCAKSLSYGRIIIACCFISFRRVLIKNYIFSIILLIRWNSHYHSSFFYTFFCLLFFTPYDCSGKIMKISQQEVLDN